MGNPGKFDCYHAAEPDEPKEEYLGDGVYASFLGDTIKLRAPRETGNHIVYIEPQVWKELARFAIKNYGEAFALLNEKSRP